MISTQESVNLLVSKVNTWIEATIQWVPNFVVAVLLMVIFYFLALGAKKIMNKVLRRVSDNQSVNNLAETIIYLTVLIVGLFIALGILNLDKTVTSLLAGAGVIGLALGFAFQEIASNFISGIFIAFQKPYRAGDIVEVGDFLGQVKKISLRTTSIFTFDGLEVFVPNKDMFTKPLTNYTTTPKRRLDLSVGVSYADDLDLVETVVKKSLQDLEGRLEEDEIEVFFKEFGSSSINLDVRVWIDYPANMNYLRSRHDAIKKIKRAFDKKDISIPFPIRTLDFGIKGGAKLSQMIPGNLLSVNQESSDNVQKEAHQ